MPGVGELWWVVISLLSVAFAAGGAWVEIHNLKDQVKDLRAEIRDHLRNDRLKEAKRD